MYSIYVFCREFPMKPDFVERGCPASECQDSEGGWHNPEDAVWGWKGWRDMCSSHMARRDAHIIMVDHGTNRIVREARITTELPDAYWEEED